jgi:SOS response regulatory protein OraA/RecX
VSRDKVLAYALKALARREHSVVGLRTKIEHRFEGVPSDTVTDILDELIRRKYLDDDRFAATFILNRPGRSRMWFEASLAQAGVEAERITLALDAQDWPSLETIVQDKMKGFGLTPPLQPKEAARLSRTLMRLGYDGEEVRAELENLL